MKALKKTQGVISIFLVIILVPMMTVSSLIVDASKVSLAKGVVESSGDLALNTALTNYDTSLKELYGLLATSQNMDEVLNAAKGYFESTLASAGIEDAYADDIVSELMESLSSTTDSDTIADIMNIEASDIEMQINDSATLANSTVMKKQIVEFMKYRSPINTGLGFISSLESFTTLSEQSKLVEKRQDYYEAEQTVMENAQKAWKYINEYNKTDINKNSSYLTQLEKDFASYKSEFEEFAIKTIKDLYDTQNYDSYSKVNYQFVAVNNEEGKLNHYDMKIGSQKQSTVDSLTKYSDSKKATASNISTAMKEYYTALNNFLSKEKALDKFGTYNSSDYDVQYIVQMNRGKYFQNYLSSMKTLYNKYINVLHAVNFAGTQENGQNAMEASYEINGSSSQLKVHYENIKNDFHGRVPNFTNKFSNYSSNLSKISNSVQSKTNTSSVNSGLSTISKEINSYISSLKSSSSALGSASDYLGYVLDGIKKGGSLDTAKNNWSTATNNSKIKNTELAQQDRAEIENLGEQFDYDEVKTLKDKVDKLKANIDKVLEQIETYTFFDKKIYEINSYETLKNLLSQKIGDSKLKSVSIVKTELEKFANDSVSEKFKIGKKIDISWKNNCKPKISDENNKFYNYLETHFSSAEDSTELKKENESNGSSFYDSIKSQAKETQKTANTFP